MACVAVNSLMRTIEIEFLQSRPRPILQQNGLISFNKHLIQSLHEKLGYLLEQLDEKRIHGGTEAIIQLETQLSGVAFRVEDEIEQEVVDLYVKSPQQDSDHDVEKAYYHQSCLAFCQIFHQPKRKLEGVKSGPALRLHHILQQAIEDIDAIKEELEKVKIDGKHVEDLQGRNNNEVEVLPEPDEVFMKGNSSQHAPHSKDIMVGKNYEFSAVIEMLIQHPSKKREVVSIKGMGGIGKTTLARRIYDDPSIRSYFDKQAWVVASQLHNKRQMLISLLNSMGSTVSGKDEDLALKLYQGLKGRRYLVVMDDVWSGEAWDSIKACFPDDTIGSRILLTTRLVEVANYVRFNNDFSLQMQLLDQSESWNLFCEKACGSRSVQLEMIGRPIVEKCKGLPLAIVVVAGLFSKLNTLDEWRNIVESLNSLATTTVDEECSRILSLSYNHLPHNLKACFLYLGVFPEDHEISANHLARLWSAEGLVKTYENESFDMVTKRYIQELMDRNLILLSRRSRCGRKIKSFKIHDILHTFCAREAQNKNLLHVIHENGSDFPQNGFRWLSIQSTHFDIPTLYSSSKSCRSIFYFTRATSLDLENFNLLRVVYFTNRQMSRNHVDLVLLRHISEASEDLNDLEPFRAWNIQTLAISSNDGRNYLELPQLQYLDCPSFHGYPLKYANKNLQTLFWLRSYHCTEGFLTKFPSLKVVGIKGERRECNDCIENLVCVQQLEELYIVVNIWNLSPLVIPINGHIASLKSLRKLTFQLTKFEWKGIHVLCKLPGLEVLELDDFACVGKDWEMPEEEKFDELVYLEIGKTNLKYWKASSYNFPKLEHMLLFYCMVLEEIPTGFSEISTLKSIKLAGCLPSAVTSAKIIEEEQRDYGNDDIIVIVKHTLQPHEDAFDEDDIDQLKE